MPLCPAPVGPLQQGAELPDAVYRRPSIHLVPGQAGLPRGNHRHLVPALRQSMSQKLGLPMSAADERRIVVACEQDSHR